MTETYFQGVFRCLVSPVGPPGEVDAEVLARLCDDLISAGVHGLTPLGSTGEFAYLSWTQRRAPLPPQAPLSPKEVEEVRRALVTIGAL